MNSTKSLVSTKSLTIIIVMAVLALTGVYTLLEIDKISDGRGSVMALIALIMGDVICLLLLRELFRMYRRSIAAEKKLKKDRKEAMAKQLSYLDSLRQQYGADAIECKYLAGSGNEFKDEATLLMFADADQITLIDPTTHATQALVFGSLLSIEISGPGTVKSDAGITGGGFGVAGFLQGAVTAAVLNKLTESSSTNTFLRLMTNSAEYYLHTSAADPATIRKLLSALFVKLEARKHNPTDATDPAKQIEKLHKLKLDGALSSEEFDAAKKRILGI